MKKNSYNVPDNQWNQFGDQGQEFFNRLYEFLRGNKQTYLKEAPHSLTQQKEDLNQFTDKIILQVAIDATNQYTEQTQKAL